MMDPKELFTKSLEQAGSCVLRVEERQLTEATPCTDWNLRDLINHMVYELLWVPELLAGKTVQEVGGIYDGDVLGDGGVQSAWERASTLARTAVLHADLDKEVHLSYGDVSAAAYISELAGDILIHGWDVAQSVNCSLLLDEKSMLTVYENTLPRKDELQASGLFAKAIDYSEQAPLQVRLLGLFGRRDRGDVTE